MVILNSPPVRLIRSLEKWCAGKDSNLHALWALPPQGSVSTNFTTRAQMECQWYLTKLGQKGKGKGEEAIEADRWRIAVEPPRHRPEMGTSPRIRSLRRTHMQTALGGEGTSNLAAIRSIAATIRRSPLFHRCKDPVGRIRFLASFGVAADTAGRTDC